MRKYEFDYEPSLLEQEGSQMRINFGVERVEREMPAMGDGEPTVRTVFMAHVVRVPMPMDADAVRQAVIAEGGTPLEADVVAAEAMFVSGGSSDLALAKAFVTAKVMAFDSSDAVNLFTIGGKAAWIPREYREMFATRLEQEKRRGHETVSLDLPDAQPGDEPLTLNVEVATAMLEQLNDYATDCYDATKGHVRNVNALTTVEEVLAYDYTTGYPEKLSF